MYWNTYSVNISEEICRNQNQIYRKIQIKLVAQSTRKNKNEIMHSTRHRRAWNAPEFPLYQTNQQPENNAPQTTYDFYACFFFDRCIKVTTSFPVGDSWHNPFFSRLTLRAPVSTQKKCIVIELDNVEK